MSTTHLTVGEIIDFLANIADVRFELVEGCPAGNIAVRFGQSQDRALQTHIHRVCECGVIRLRVIAVDLIHPTLRTQAQTFYNNKCATKKKNK